jgi:hypothetical protein
MRNSIHFYDFFNIFKLILAYFLIRKIAYKTSKLHKFYLKRFGKMSKLGKIIDKVDEFSTSTSEQNMVKKKHFFLANATKIKRYFKIVLKIKDV